MGAGESREKFNCRVLMLDSTQQTHLVSNHDLGIDLLDKVFIALDLYEKEYFGLKFKDSRNTMRWLDPDKPLGKQIQNYSVTFVLYFGVKFYAADPTKLREEITRYQFFLQIKQDLRQGKLTCETSIAAELCAYSIQSELGDYDENIHTNNFISEFRFIPNQPEELETKIAEIYPKLRGVVPAEAELNFLERVKWLEMYGVELRRVIGQDGQEYALGLTPTGIVLFKEKIKIGSFIWPKVTKLKSKGSRFFLRATQGRNDEEKEYTFILPSKQDATGLWQCCAEHHTFFRLEKAKDVPASAYNFLFKKSASFKGYSGGSQSDNESARRRTNNQPPIQRTASQRYNRRNTNESTENRDARNTGKNNNIERSLSYDQRSDISGDSTPPWEKRGSVRRESGLYTGQTTQPKSTNQMSPKFPKKIVPGGNISESEAESRKKRNKYYSGYTSQVQSDGEQIKPKSRFGSEPTVVHKSGHQSDESRPHNYFDTNHSSKQHSRPRSAREQSADESQYESDKKYRASGTRSDGEAEHQRRRRQQQPRPGISDAEMVPALDVYRTPAPSSMGVATPSTEERRQRRREHRDQREHRPQRDHPKPGYDPTNSQVLLELGPESASEQRTSRSGGHHGNQLIVDSSKDSTPKTSTSHSASPYSGSGAGYLQQQQTSHHTSHHTGHHTGHHSKSPRQVTTTGYASAPGGGSPNKDSKKQLNNYIEYGPRATTRAPAPVQENRQHLTSPNSAGGGYTSGGGSPRHSTPRHHGSNKQHSTDRSDRSGSRSQLVEQVVAPARSRIPSSHPNRHSYTTRISTEL